MKLSPVTGEKIPDETARKPLERYVNPRKAAWPQADFVVGNPPFIGAKGMRTALGDGYVEALRNAWPDVPESADFVMYWWHQAAQLTRNGALHRFGLITTNSIRQAFNRRVIEAGLVPTKSSGSERALSLSFAIPDHPWVDTADGAAVRIAMTVANAGTASAVLRNVIDERDGGDEVSVTLREKRGLIHSDLRIGADVVSAKALRANERIANRGVQALAPGFVIEATDVASIDPSRLVADNYLNGRDLTDRPRHAWVLDTYPLKETELRSKAPSVYQWLLNRAKPERDQNPRLSYREKWWLLGENQPLMRESVQGLCRYIATAITSKHRNFEFVDARTLGDQALLVIATEDGGVLGVLSSQVHLTWALAAGGTLENRPRYNKSRCFDPFPFPVANEGQATRIRDLAEHLDAHRKRQQAAHPDLTLTGMYNVLDKLRSGEPLTAKERVIHEQGLVSVLRQLHDDLDAAVLDAYGWSDLLPLLRIAMGMDARVPRAQDAQERLHGNDAPADGQTRDDARRAFDEAILERLVALNAERAAEEARGHIRWLRPEFQNPQHARPDAPADAAPEQGDAFAHADADTDDDNRSPLAGEGGAQRRGRGTPDKPIPWPKDTVAQVRAVADVLAASPAPLSLDDIAARFTARGPWKKRLPQLLDMLVALGRAEPREGGVYGVGR